MGMESGMGSFKREGPGRIPQIVSPERMSNEEGQETLTVEQARQGLMMEIREFAQAHPDATAMDLQVLLIVKARTRRNTNQESFKVAAKGLQDKIQNLSFKAPFSEGLLLLERKDETNH